MRRYRLAALGGTFDHLHVGHQALLATAFRVGQIVAVGVTTDRFLRDHPKPFSGRIQSYRRRRESVRRWLRRQYPKRVWRLTPLENPFGRSTDPEVDVLVVSVDTARGGRAVNRERRRLGRPPIPIVPVPLVLADDLEPVSSRRIRAGVVTARGVRRSPVRVHLAARKKSDRAAALRAVRDVFRHPIVVTAGRAELTLRVEPARGGWWVSESTDRIRLSRQRVPGDRPRDLRLGLARRLRSRV